LDDDSSGLFYFIRSKRTTLKFLRIEDDLGRHRYQYNSMSEEDSKVPKPDIKPESPETPPVTTVDAEAPKEEKKEETNKPSTPSGNIEADLMKRFLGALIDGIIIAVIASIISSVVSNFIISLIVPAVLWLTRDSLPFLEGQSIGKKLMKTKAVKLDGSSLSGDWATGATRNILFAIPFGGLVEGIIFLIRKDGDQKGTRLGDDWAKTKVISVE